MPQLEFEVWPPRATRVGVTLNPPIAVAIRAHDNDELLGMYAVATLLRYTSREVVQDTGMLTGTLSSSPYTYPGEDILPGSSGSYSQSYGYKTSYVYFHDLAINQLGSYRIRITLVKMDYDRDEAVVYDYIDTDRINVVANRVDPDPLSKLSHIRSGTS